MSISPLRAVGAGIVAAVAALIPASHAFAQTNSANVSVTQSVQGNSVAGGTVTVAVTIDADAEADILALSLRTTLPAGTSFQNIASTSGPQPPIKPEAGDTGTLEFAWIDVPAFPYILSINVALDGTFATPADIVSQAEYRTTGPAEFSNASVLTLEEADNGPAWKQGILAGCAASGGDVASPWTDWVVVAMVLALLVAARLAQPRAARERQRHHHRG
ncbi:MAG: hypothetical protein RLZZ303_3290 [Candidatus Hydrogenedentota bacterium]